MLEQYGHGGDLRTAADIFGQPKDGFLDFSSNMNPLGPPEAVRAMMADRWRELAHYPDPAVRELTLKLAARHGVDPACILVGNGAAELIDLTVRALRPGTTGLVRPSFSEYEEAVHKCGGRIVDIPVQADRGFELQLPALQAAAAGCDLLFLGHPNNPTGRLLPADVRQALAEGSLGKGGCESPHTIVDEAFLDFVAEEERFTLARAAAQSRRLIVIRSMTKFYAVPGIRLGYAVAHPERIAELRRLQVPWSVNAPAQWIGAAALDDRDYAQRTLAWLKPAREQLVAGLRGLGLQVYDSEVNFVLFSLRPLGLRIGDLQREMGRRGILIRDASTFPGLDASYGRLAVKRPEDHRRLIAALREALEALLADGQAAGKASAAASSPASARTIAAAAAARPGPAGSAGSPPYAATLMLQGTASDVGKSLLTAALCRILLQDGHRVAPFKSQNMSLNSYVTPDGKEIGRAQGMQADACRIAATTDMNPILLKPKKDMVSQVVVHGKPYRDLDARAYRERYLPEAEGVVKEALHRLRQTCDIVVIEGAGSPAEVNLKDRDIVNMRLAGWADAPVLLVADIDRGGVFASLVGTLDILTPEERARVQGFVINKFRGDATLLKPGIDWLEARTGKPVLGVIPYLPDLGLEDEDSASLDRKLAESSGHGAPKGTPDEDGVLDIAVIRHPRLSNFTDIDPLLYEPDVRVRFVTTAAEFGRPDAVIVPGSKNTVDDLLFLRETGLDRQIQTLAAHDGWIVGICAGYQMLGARLLDPDLVESDRPELPGLGLFPTETVFASDKRTVRVEGRTALYAGAGEAGCPVTGYEIHMGRTTFLEPVTPAFRVRPCGFAAAGTVPDSDELTADGAASANGRQWGTYLHGILHNDGFRRAFLNQIRVAKGWEPLPAALRFLERREAAFDRLADHVRMHLDMDRLYEMIQNK
ncbi:MULTISPECIES: cobyric acid synthase [Paenibacillus]|uniref:Cobyric acid synthase n=1 Tax=Paenibacillus validus TaxID=44253 RepID=A0A7X2Z9K8_9BACL|nr:MULTISPECIES: cobyric acid synthase [Paenibacillus]MUG70874.1 cobyric acid synthase [Paenibacillus validus]